MKLSILISVLILSIKIPALLYPLQNQLTKLQGSLISLKGKLAALKNSLDKMKENLSAPLDQTKNLELKIQNLEQILEDKNKQIQVLQEKLNMEKNESEKTELSLLVEQLEKEKIDLTTKIENYETSLVLINQSPNDEELQKIIKENLEMDELFEGNKEYADTEDLNRTRPQATEIQIFSCKPRCSSPSIFFS